MKTMKLKGLFLCLVFLLCNATSHAADDLITQQITIKLDKAGTLPNKIESSKKYKITKNASTLIVWSIFYTKFMAVKVLLAITL